MEPAEDSFRSGCECRKDELCQFSECQCLGDVEDSDSDSDGPARQNRRLQVYAYQTRGQRAGMLNPRMLKRECRAPIYECHDGCACSEECPNRVVERGRRVPLQIFRTKNRGWGKHLTGSGSRVCLICVADIWSLLLLCQEYAVPRIYKRANSSTGTLAR